LDEDDERNGLEVEFVTGAGGTRGGREVTLPESEVRAIDSNELVVTVSGVVSPSG